MRFISTIVAIIFILYPSHVFADVSDPENIGLDQRKLAGMENPALLHEESKMVRPL